MTKHELKVWPQFFDDIFHRRKMFDVRKNDRDYRVGDWAIFRNYDPESKTYLGGICGREITYILDGGQFGIEPGYVVLSLN